MSDETQPPEKPTVKTATVPLKKETVRITLRAKPAGETGQIPVAPAAPRPPGVPPPSAGPGTAPLRPTAPPVPPGASSPTVPIRPSAPPVPGGAPRPPVSGAPTVPLRPAAPPVSGAPTVPLRPAAPPVSGAPTVPLRPVAGASQPLAAAPQTGPVTGQPTMPLRPGVSGAGPLPQATRPLSGAPSTQVTRTVAPTATSSQELVELDEEVKDPNAGMIGFGVAALLASLAALGVALWSSDKTGMMEPTPQVPQWEVKNDIDGSWQTKFAASHLVEIPDIKKPNN